MSTYQNLQKCKRVISGIDETGAKNNKGCRDGGIISLCNGEGIRRPPISIGKALVSSATNKSTKSFEKYSYMIRHDELEKAILRQCANKDSLPVVLDAGSTRIFLNIFERVLPKNPRIFLEIGFYHSFLAWAQLTGSLICVTGEQDQETTKTSIESLESAKAKYGPPDAVVVINPTYAGEIYSESDLRKIASWCAAHQCVLIEDAVFQGTEYSTPSARILDVVDRTEKIISVNSVSKSLGLSNIRLGWAIGCAEGVDTLRHCSDIGTVSIPFLSANMALEAMQNSAHYKKFCAQQNILRASYLEKLIKNENNKLKKMLGGSKDWMAIRQFPCSGQNMFIRFPALESLFKQLGMNDSADLCRAIAEKENVMLSPALSSGYTCSTCRISYSGVGVDIGYPISQKYESEVIESALRQKHINIDVYEKRLNDELNIAYRASLQILNRAISKVSSAVFKIVEGI